jgi:hypothetical protein
MSNYVTNVPLINEPLVRPDGRISEAWFMFLIQLFRRTGGTQGTALDDFSVELQTLVEDPAISVLGDAVDSLNTLLQTLPDDSRRLSQADQLATEFSLLSNGDDTAAKKPQLDAVALDVALILHEAQDVLTKVTRRLQDALIDQMTGVDVIRSMASQDAGNVKITGGSITGVTTNNATSVALTDDTTTNATMYPVFGSGSGTSALKISTTKLTWNPSTGLFTAPSFSGQFNGTLGVTTPAAAIVTTLSATQAVTLSPANANVTLSPTGTGLVTINPATAGAMDNVTIGATTAKAGTFTQLSIGGLTTGIADFRTSTGAVVVAGRLSNAAATSQPGAYTVYSPNASGTVLIWNQWRSVVANATAGSEASSMIFSTRVAGSFVDVVTIDSSGNLVNQKGVADASYSYQTPATGFSITIGAGVRTLVLDPAGTLATGTITMPASPVDGQEIRISSSQNITALTVSANAGQSIKNAPTAFTVSTTGQQGYAFIYRASNTTWYRLQ